MNNSDIYMYVSEIATRVKDNRVRIFKSYVKRENMRKSQCTKYVDIGACCKNEQNISDDKGIHALSCFVWSRIV